MTRCGYLFVTGLGCCDGARRHRGQLEDGKWRAWVSQWRDGTEVVDGGRGGCRCEMMKISQDGGCIVTGLGDGEG